MINHSSNWIGTYILDPSTNTPIPCADVYEWGEWYFNTDRTVLRTVLPNDVCVSTVFIGIDMSMPTASDSPFAPYLWETMVFGPSPIDSELICRYTSVEAAVEGHNQAVRALSLLRSAQ
jgi:hypothetical protein